MVGVRKVGICFDVCLQMYRHVHDMHVCISWGYMFPSDCQAHRSSGPQATVSRCNAVLAFAFDPREDHVFCGYHYPLVI